MKSISVRESDIETVRNSGLFDVTWYLTQYPDVEALGLDPVEHYLWLGAALGRNPSAAFDTRAYLSLYADVANTNVNPLLHYVTTGQQEGREIATARPNDAFSASLRAMESSVHEANGGVSAIEYTHTDGASIKRSYTEFDRYGEKRFLEALERKRTPTHPSPERRVSVVMPTFNRSGTIRIAIESVRAQSHQNWELIIVDDGSTDDTPAVVAPFLDDERIRYVRHRHVGVSGARNYGLLESTGEFVAYLDTDNTWEPGFLRDMTTFVISENLDAAYSAIRVTDDSKGTLRYRGDVFVWSACKRANYIDLNCFMHRRDLAINDDRNELFDTTLRRLVDWDFILRLTTKAKVSYAPFVGVNYYDGEKASRITRSEYQNGEMPAVTEAVRAKHSSLDQAYDNFDIGSGVRLARGSRQSSAGAERSVWRFFPDYRINNAYQSLLYGGIGSQDVHPGNIDNCLQLITRSTQRHTPCVVFHLHWLNPLVSPARNSNEAALLVDSFLAKARLFVSLGGQILWTIHNVVSHEPKYLDEEIRLSKGLVNLADWIHVHHASVVEAAKPYYELPPEKVVVAEHGNYIGTLPNTISREEARRELGLPQDTIAFLFLGQIRGYKGIDDLIRAFAEFSSTQSNCRLVVAGKVLGIDSRELEKKLSALPNLVFRPGYVPDEEMQIYLKSADVMVLPYKKVLTSGSVFLAFSFELPVICPREGLLRHLVEDERNGLTYDGADQDGLLSALRRFSKTCESQVSAMRGEARRTAEAHVWEETSAKLARYVDGSRFGTPARYELPQSSHMWFVRGDIEALRQFRCIAIVLHYNHLDDTRQCVTSLLEQGEDVGVVIVSNSEDVSDIRKLASEFPDILAIQAEGNLGYAAGNNIGLRICREIACEFFWIINPDIRLADGYYATLKERAARWPHHDFFGSTLVFAHRPDTVAFCGGEIKLELGAKPGHMHMGRNLADLPNDPFECDYLTGANIFGRTRALEKIGYLPEDYFLYFEETDWFARWTRSEYGRKPLVFPDMVLQNGKRSESKGLPARYYMYYFCRNALLFAKRYAPDRIEESKIEVQKFAEAWLGKIERRAPDRLVEFRDLVYRAMADAESGKTGKAPGI